jgi:hypothetical protein
MGRISGISLVIVAATTLSVSTSAGPTLGAASDPPGSTPAAPLMDAVRYAPLGARNIQFTDWSAIKTAYGNEAVTSSTPIDVRTEAMLAMTTTVRPLATFAITHFPTHADVWAWDSTDLDWEASFAVDGPPVAVVRFRDDFDLASVRQRYEERGFTATTHRDATIFSHEMDLGAEWLRGSDFGVLNTAFLDDGRTLVLSSGIGGVTAAIDALAVDVVRAPPAWLVAEALGSPLTAGIDVETDVCIAYDPRWLPGGDAGPNEELLRSVGTLQAWEGLGIGIDSALQGRFVLAYATPEAAASDLEGRVRLAQQGVSLVHDEPYADSVFRVRGSTVEGSGIRLDVEPLDGRADRLSQAFILRDLLFAACG